MGKDFKRGGGKPNFGSRGMRGGHGGRGRGGVGAKGKAKALIEAGAARLGTSSGTDIISGEEK